jgi:predicted AAA+ superfamily ATPase
MEMKRALYKNLLDWKSSPTRKPLLLQGARQVGKTYLLEDFGKKEFPKFHVFNFEQDRSLSHVFEADLSPIQILADLSIHTGDRINSQSDLVIFDEIQACPRALTSLKYFCESMPELAICCAGSLLGVALSSESFPVGKVEFQNLFPMTFSEFLESLNEDLLIEVLGSYRDVNTISEAAHQKLWGCLKEYYVTGGMPQVISEYIPMRDNRFGAMNNTRKIQKELIEGYYRDFAKHSGKTNSMHIVSVFEDVPMQLSNNVEGSVSRYRFKGVIPGKKGYADLNGPISWLEKAGLIFKVKICNKAELPLESFCKNNLFKLYFFDIGLLGCMLDLPVEAIIAQDYGITKGYFAENFTAQEFVSAGVSKLYAWKERNSEIEFLRVLDGEIVPVEVKSGNRTKAKSLQQYQKKYAPLSAIIISGKTLNRDAKKIVKNYPLYLAGSI